MLWPVLRLPAFVALLILVAISCGPGQPAYLDHVRPLPLERADPRFGELVPLLSHRSATDADDLVRTWNDYLGDIPVPFRDETVSTFVYYDFTGTLKQVYLETSFAPGRKDPLTRIAGTGLFARVFDIPRTDTLRYRYSDGVKPLADPFNPDVEVGGGHWHSVVDPASANPSVQEIVGASEANLGGQDVRILLPPNFRRNLGWTYPLVVVVGLEGDNWTQLLGQMMLDNTVQPFLVAAVVPGPGGGSPAELKKVLEDRLVPWLRLRYRASPLPSDLLLVGWGTSAKSALDLAASRPDFWVKTWVPGDQPKTPDSWTALALPYFKTQFPVETP